MNIWDIVLLVLIAAALFLAVRQVRRVKKRGGCSCGGCASCPSCGGCAGCPSRGGCEKQRKN